MTEPASLTATSEDQVVLMGPYDTVSVPTIEPVSIFERVQNGTNSLYRATSATVVVTVWLKLNELDTN